MNCECAICKNYKPFRMPEEIIDAAQKGKLVFFCGAGISTENKTVLPHSFYTSIMAELKIKDNNLSFSELMQKFCDLPNGRRELLKKYMNELNIFIRFQNLNITPPHFIENCQNSIL